VQIRPLFVSMPRSAKTYLTSSQLASTSFLKWPRSVASASPRVCPAHRLRPAAHSRHQSARADAAIADYRVTGSTRKGARPRRSRQERRSTGRRLQRCRGHRMCSLRALRVRYATIGCLRARALPPLRSCADSSKFKYCHPARCHLGTGVADPSSTQAANATVWIMDSWSSPDPSKPIYT
jgi:hypothetical protein